MLYQTKILTASGIELAATLLRQGECVAFPTETVYGLGANALDEEAVAKIFAAKGRPSDNPLIIHCHDIVQVKSLALDWPQAAEMLMDRFWPGPLTLVLPKKPHIPGIVTGGLDTVALRIPDHPIALALIQAAKLPIAAPSANTSGKPSPTQAEHVWQDMAGKIPAIIDGGPTGWGVESTVLDCTSTPFRLLRPGGITIEELRDLIPVEVDSGVYQETDIPRSPGMKYKHYAPDAKVVLVVGKQIQSTINKQIKYYRSKGKKVAVMAFEESRNAYPDTAILDMGSKYCVNTAASRIYHLLRKADILGFDIILIEGLPDQNLGMAIMNRLRKASSNNVIET